MMLRRISSLSPHRLYILQQVNSLSPKCCFSSLNSLPHSSPDTTHLDSNPLCFSGIAQSVFSRCYGQNLDRKIEKDKNLKDLLLEISRVVPEWARRFCRVSELKPNDVLEILSGFESECGRFGLEEARKVESLWSLFKWAYEQQKGFEHLSESWEVMARILVRFRLLKEAELLLLDMDSQGTWLESPKVLGNMIEGYVSCGDSDRAVSIYDRMKHRGLTPSISCHRAFLNQLIRTRETQLAFRVSMDMAEIGISSDRATNFLLDGVIRLLCADGKIQEARDLVKKFASFGFKVSNLDVDGIVYGYCEKKNFDEVLSFFRQIESAPNVLAGNRVIHSVCENIGTERAQEFLEDLETLGFVPDQITFSILIRRCCQEGKLSCSFLYMTEMYSRRLKPDTTSYKFIICSLFLKEMWANARNVFDEVVEMGLKPDLSTYRMLLAGFCIAKHYKAIKQTINMMERSGLLQNVLPGSHLPRALLVLGFDPLTVKIKRENHKDFIRADFVDDLGNGLYLDTNLSAFDRKLDQILEDSLVLPDYNSLLLKACKDGNIKVALTLADEMLRWGQELSLPAFSALLKGLLSSENPLQVYEKVLEQNLKLFNMLDEESLNLLVRVYCKKGWTYEGKLILDGMFKKGLKIENKTYTAMITSLCQKGNSSYLKSLWDIARKERWVPQLERCEALLQGLCDKGMLKETLELLEDITVSNPHLQSDTYNLFLDKLCCMNFSGVARVLLHELSQRGCALDHGAYSHVMRGMCKEKEYLPALNILNDAMAKKLVPSLDVVISLIYQLCRANRRDEAISLKEMSMRDHPRSSLLISNALMKGLCMTSKVGEATALFHDMLVKGIVPDAETFNIFLEGLCKANDLVGAEEIFGRMLKEKIELSVSNYRNLVRLMCLKGKVFPALNLKEITKNSRDLIVYNILIFQLFSTGNNLFVNLVLDDLQRKKLPLNEVSYNFLVYGFFKCEDASSALRMLSTMINKEARPTYRNLRIAITTLCRSDQLEKALELSQYMELQGYLPDSTVQNEIVESLFSLGKFQEAEIFLDRLSEKKLIPNNINYNNLIKRFCLCGKPRKAVDLVNLMLKKGIVPSSASYQSVIISCCARNEMNEAMDFLTEMLDRDLRPNMSTWKALVGGFLQDGRTVEAEGVLGSMVEIGETPPKDMFTSVIDKYHSQNSPKKASEVVQMMQKSGFELDFEAHWSVIGSLRTSVDQADNAEKSTDTADKSTKTTGGKKLLSKFLSDSGFSKKK